MLTHALLILAGFVLLSFGAESLVRGSVRLALRRGISPLIVGLTVVAFGTSTPELFVSVKASLSGSGDIAVGNIVGSNIFNIAVILGLSAMIYPIGIHSQLIRQDIPVMITVSLLFGVMVRNQTIQAPEGIVLLVLLVVYVMLSIRMAKRGGEAELTEEIVRHLPTKPGKPLINLAMIGGGIALLVGGSHLLIIGATSLARAANVSEAIIGLTIVAAGTGLPELATSVAAAIKKESDIAIGNIIGSNIFNILCIGGLSSIVRPLHTPDIEYTDLVVMCSLAAILLPMSWTGSRLGRIEAALLLASYGAYLFFIWPAAY